MKRLTVKRKQTLLILLLILFSGCAYFNTFYNAKMYYQKGYQETKRNRTGKVTSSERNNYQKAIEKAAKLIEEYPNSKYVDDAQLLLGKAFYLQQDYLKASRKFKEIISNYQESEVANEAELWLAKTQIELGYIEDAENNLLRFVEKDHPKHMDGEAYYYLGQLSEDKQNYQKAIEYYEEAIQSDLQEKHADALFSIGANYDSLGQNDQAAEYFRRVLKHNPVLALRFESNFRFGVIQKKKKRLNEAIGIFENLLGDEKYKEWAPRLRLEIAECLVLIDDVEGGIIAYQDIIEDLKSTKRPYAAKAFFELGTIYERKFLDFERALDQFQEVKNHDPRSLIADTAEINIREIQRFLALRQVIAMGIAGEDGILMLEDNQIEEDSLTVDQLYTLLDTTRTDSAKFQFLIFMGGETFGDSIMNELEVIAEESSAEARAREMREEEMTGVNWWRWMKNHEMPNEDALQQEIRLYWYRQEQKKEQELTANPELQSFLIEERDRNLFLLAELYFFHFQMVDSAMTQYQMIIQEFPNSPFAPRALFNIAHIYKNIQYDSVAADTCYKRLITLYPLSSLVNPARNAIGLTAQLITSDQTPDELFLKAETSLLENKDTDEALKIYQYIFEQFPNSEWAPKVIYSMGWIHENLLDSVSKAINLYDSLVVKYPESLYAQKVKPRLRIVKEKNQETVSDEDQKEGEIEKEALSDSTQIQIQQDSSSIDSTRLHGDFQEDLKDSLMNHKEFLFDSSEASQIHIDQEPLKDPSTTTQ